MLLDVNENDVTSVVSAIAELHKLRAKLTRHQPAARISNVRWDKRLAATQDEHRAIVQIFSADISSIYESAAGDRSFYVYVHCNPSAKLNVKDNARHLFAATELALESQPFYVGKGTGDRFLALDRNEGHRKIRQHLHKINGEILPVKLMDDLTEGQALALESKLIDIFGLKSLSPHGMLVNLDEGVAPATRRSLYPKGTRGPAWYLNRLKLQPYSVPKG